VTKRTRLRLHLGVLCGLLVLIPAVLVAEVVTRTYERRATDDVNSRAVAGLDALTTLFEQERTRTLNNAEVAGERLGPLVASGTAGRNVGYWRSKPPRLCAAAGRCQVRQ
jgi:hypothetical protein